MADPRARRRARAGTAGDRALPRPDGAREPRGPRPSAGARAATRRCAAAAVSSIESGSPTAPATVSATLSGGMKRRLNIAAGVCTGRGCCCSTSRRSASTRGARGHPRAAARAATRRAGDPAHHPRPRAGRRARRPRRRPDRGPAPRRRPLADLVHEFFGDGKELIVTLAAPRRTPGARTSSGRAWRRARRAALDRPDRAAGSTPSRPSAPRSSAPASTSTRSACASPACAACSSASRDGRSTRERRRLPRHAARAGARSRGARDELRCCRRSSS